MSFRIANIENESVEPKSTICPRSQSSRDQEVRSNAGVEARHHKFSSSCHCLPHYYGAAIGGRLLSSSGFDPAAVRRMSEAVFVPSAVGVKPGAMPPCGTNERPPDCGICSNPNEAHRQNSHLRLEEWCGRMCGRRTQFGEAADTRQTLLPVSSAISKPPRLSTARPTGRPRALSTSTRKPVTTSSAGPDGRPLANGTKTIL